MPIYAYRCEACGFAKDVLQKVSDTPLTDCLSCGKPSFKKQLTAAGFQLKGTGWYATDFKGGAGTAAPAIASDAAPAAPVTPAAGEAAPATPAAAPAASPTTTAPSGGAAT